MFSILIMGSLFFEASSAVLINTKPILGSTCLHNLETGLPMLFDRTELAALGLASSSIQITQRGVRFISYVQHLRSGGMGPGNVLYGIHITLGCC